MEMEGTPRMVGWESTTSFGFWGWTLREMLTNAHPMRFDLEVPDAEPHHTLLWFLRDRLGLTGRRSPGRRALEGPEKQRGDQVVRRMRENTSGSDIYIYIYLYIYIYTHRESKHVGLG